MNKLIGKGFFNLFNLVFFLILISCGEQQPKEIGLPFYNKADFTPEWIDESSSEYERIHTIGNFSFTNQFGKKITEENIKNKITIANFFFTSCPGICPKMMNNLDRVQTKYGEDNEVVLLSHSVTPWVDSVDVLFNYAEVNNITSPNWHLLTGDKLELYTMGRDSYFADEGFGKSVTLEDDFLHTENIVLVDFEGRIRGVYNGTLKLETNRLLEDIQWLKDNK